jgi:hypothetical protein
MGDIEDQIIKTATDIIQPVMESAMILAGQYCKACGRGTLTGEDVKYCMKYAARNFVGKQIGTLFPEDEELESESESDSDSLKVVDEEDEPFTRYTGDDSLMNDINQASDTWDTWIPSSPMESMLKDSINTSY